MLVPAPVVSSPGMVYFSSLSKLKLLLQDLEQDQEQQHQQLGENGEKRSEKSALDWTRDPYK